MNFNRRDFLRGVTLGSLGLAVGGNEAYAEPLVGRGLVEDDVPTGPNINCAVIGLGPQGRELTASLVKLGITPVVAVCDIYKSPGFLKRTTDIAPSAKVCSDYREVLADKNVNAVFIATPTPTHKQIVLEALQAGKHVYCEAPLAHTIEDARAIAKAATAAKTVFQSGIQNRGNKQAVHVRNFVKSGALGTIVGGRAQWHKKVSWKNPAATPERDKQVNWRLDKSTSLGLAGEVGIHQIDTASWFMKKLPISVSGMGSTLLYQAENNGIADTIQLVLDFPGGVRYLYDASTANSFDGSYELLLGTDCSMLLRDQRAWMFKETDAPLLGWEVYARKDDLKVGDFRTATGIAMVADATKLIKQGKEPGAVGTDVTKTSIYQALWKFADRVNNRNQAPVQTASAKDGFEATVVAIKANEAVQKGTKIVFDPKWFSLDAVASVPAKPANVSGQKKSASGAAKLSSNK